MPRFVFNGTYAKYNCGVRVLIYCAKQNVESKNFEVG